MSQPPLSEQFEIASGSMLGWDHRRLGRNNQDALRVHPGKELLIAVVCDGCSEAPSSEVGARTGVEMLTTVLLEEAERSYAGYPFRHGDPPYFFWDRVRRLALGRMQDQALLMGRTFPQILLEYFLYSTVGVLMTPELTTFFHLGDGMALVNGAHTIYGPYPGNAPPYLAYNLLSTSWEPRDLQFRIPLMYATRAIDHLLVGTDGVIPLLEFEQTAYPGTTEMIGPISRFWSDDRFFRNQDFVRRTLARMNMDRSERDPKTGDVRLHNGLLKDDATLIVLRRRGV